MARIFIMIDYGMCILVDDGNELLVVVGMVLLLWLCSLLTWRMGRMDELGRLERRDWGDSLVGNGSSQ